MIPQASYNSTRLCISYNVEFKKMQKRWLVLLTIALLLFVVPAITAQDTPLPDLGGREITIAVENAYPP